MPKKEKSNAKNETTDATETTDAIEKVETTTTELAPSNSTSGYASPVLEDLAKSNPNPLFKANLGSKLTKTSKPSLSKIVSALSALPMETQENLNALLKKMSTDRVGMILSDDRPQFTELRVFHGSGNDPNRPENCLVGHFYLTSRVNVGAEFVGTPIALWQGRTMWPGQDEGRKSPICSSMDRKVGSKYSECDTCPNRPWKDGQRTNCNNDVVVFMLSKDLDELVMVRFARISASGGEQLISQAKRTLVPWQRWFSLTNEKKSSGDYRWYEIKAAPLDEDATVDPALMEVGAILNDMAMHDMILPGLAYIYRSAQNAITGDGDDEGDAGESKSGDSDAEDFDM